MPRWDAAKQEEMHRRNDYVPPQTMQEYANARTDYMVAKAFKKDVTADELGGARAPGILGPEDKGTLKDFRDPNIGTADWYADKGLQPPEPWIERWELDPNAEGFTSVVVDSETGVEVDGSREQLVVDTVGRSIGSESRVGSVADTG